MIEPTENDSRAGSPRGRSTEGAVPFPEAVRVWTRVALQSFGGPAGQIAVMHRIVVDEKRWIGESRFLHALNYCMLLPGPEAQQLATYLGWLLHGTRGGLVAGILFVLPGMLAILALSWLYVAFREAPLVEGLFFGLKAAVLAVVIEAVVRIGRRVLRGPARLGLAAAAFVAIFFAGAPFPAIVLGAALVGLLAPRAFSPGSVPAADATAGAGLPDSVLDRRGAPDTSLARALRVVLVCGALWLVPPLALAALLGPSHVWVQESLFFSKAAMVTFGGAYSVLAYVAQQAVERYGWLAPGEMLDGLGMAETTPGPLIMVVQFVGFMGAYNNPGGLSPLLAGTVGALLTTWVTFVPCFLWIFLGAPWVERLRANRRLASALAAITAAVVGVILNLAVWFGLQVLFDEVSTLSGPIGLRLLLPAWHTLDLAATAVAAAALLALFRFKAGLLAVLVAGALAGVLLRGL